MSPSRGAFYRLLHISAHSRPRFSRLRPLSHCLPTSYLSHLTSHALSLSLSSTAQHNDDNRTSNGDLHPNGVDSTLFESTTNEYKAQTIDQFEDPWHSGPSQLLLSLLGKNIKEATTTLHELRGLDTILEDRLEYAQAAGRCANTDDHKGCLAWLDHVPNYYTLPTDLRDKGNEAGKNIASTLNALTNSSAEPYVVCLALLKAISKGYIELIDKTIMSSLVWLLRHGRVVNQKKDQDWTWQFWRSIVKAACTAKAPIVPSNSKITLDDDAIADRVLRFHLNKLYNGAIRTLALSGRYQAALVWVQHSESFLKDDTCSGTRLNRFTWRVFLEEVLDHDSSASAQIKGQAGALATALSDIATSKSAGLLQEMLVLTLDKNADDINEDGTLDDRVNQMLEDDDVRGAIAVLHQALIDAVPAPRWGHLPGAIILSKVSEAVSKANSVRLQEEMQYYLEDLDRSRGARGLQHFSHMIQLTKEEKMVDCVAYCITNFQARDVEQLALLVDDTAFREVVETARRSHKLEYSKHASYLAIKNLAYLCKSDFFKMHRLYRAWLESAQHHLDESEGLVEAPSTTTTLATKSSVFEDPNLDYLFSTGTGLPDLEDASAFITYETPPTARPSIYHFNLFLKMLPASLAISTRQGTNSVKKMLQVNGLHNRVNDLAFGILKEIQRFKLEPNESTWSILLSSLARNVNALMPTQYNASQQQNDGQDEMTEQPLELDEYEKQWDRIWKLASALGMGDESPSTSAANLPKATALTYAELIYGFLMIPPSRGGPCIKEANRVKGWLQSDHEALRYLDSGTARRVNRILGILEREQASPEQRQAFMLKDRADHFVELEERLELPSNFR